MSDFDRDIILNVKGQVKYFLQFLWFWSYGCLHDVYANCWDFDCSRMGTKLPSRWMSVLDWKSLWIFIVDDIVCILRKLFFCSMDISFGLTRLQLRFVF